MIPMVIYSPLRYPGGKNKIAPYIKQLIKRNCLLDCVYVEPYAGGASVGLSLLLDEYASKIIINDIDLSLYAFWYSILNQTEQFCKLIEETPVTIETWRYQKEKQLNKKNYTLLELGFSTFFLNRVNYSGIIKGGVIGGLKQEGKWKINARYNKKDLIKRIKKISLYKNRIEVYNLDAINLIDLIRIKYKKNVLIYFDPPYYINGKNLYLNYYDNKDHKDLLKEIQKLKVQNWILTYDNVKQIKTLYSDYRQRKYSLQYSANRPNRGEELMIFSNDLHRPKNFLAGISQSLAKY